MAKERAKYNIRSISEDDLESAGDACYQAFNNLAQQARLLTPHADFENVDIAIGVIRSKLQKLSDGVDGIVAVDSEGKVLGGCFGEVMGEVIAVGPVFVRPEAGGQGIGKAVNAALLNKIQERQWSSVRLVQNTMNNVSFRLYHSLGYRVADMWSFFTGFVKPDAVPSHADLSVRRLEERDVPACAALYTEATGLHREQNIREASAAWPSWVVTEGERIVGYRTSPIVTGHGVFETEAAFAALHGAASEELREKGGPPLAIHIPCRIYPQLIDWALRSGLKLARQNAHMVIGDYKDPKSQPIYSPSIEC